MSDFSLIIAGFGGQGVLFAGKAAAYCALLEGKEVSWLPSYGPEMRGGTANCGVCISDTPIGSPLVTRPHALIAMNGPSLQKFLPLVMPGGLALADSSIIKQMPESPRARLVPVPASDTVSREGLGGVANMLLLGKLLRETGFSVMDTMREALAECVPPRKKDMLEKNIRAVELGFALDG
ncbi:MAG: 2-oxoacid:acceptor oxidoreductase family protein [Oscillospiraceae bacterium]|jgi:2-oxoglutarate ferredoxin oxidoreductase subunit gamma|nr:2-oxoacid:acceptor oxidoreductase family protein [Oscillospiraceae bacterium]